MNTGLYQENRFPRARAFYLSAAVAIACASNTMAAEDEIEEIVVIGQGASAAYA